MIKTLKCLAKQKTRFPLGIMFDLKSEYTYIQFYLFVKEYNDLKKLVND